MENKLIKTDDELNATFSLTVEGDTIRIVFLEDFTDDELNYRIAVLIAEGLERIFAQDKEKKYKVIVDVTPLTAEIGYLTQKTREIYARMMDHAQVIKTAIFGMNKFYEIGVNLMISLMRGKGKTRTFARENVALEWLKI